MIPSRDKPVKDNTRIVRWIKLSAVGLGLYMALVLGKDLFNLRGGYARLDEARRALAEQQARSEELRVKYSQVQSGEYLEEIARDKLNMQKPGETVVLLPNLRDQKEVKLPESDQAQDEPNYLKWWNLIR